MSANIPRAIKAYEDFSGHQPTHIDTVQLPSKNVAGWKMGKVEGIAYEARRDGETAKYYHKFKAKARPNLVAQDDGKQLYLTDGRYKVTDHGIEDDMASLLVLNPSPRPSRRKKTRKNPIMAKRRRSPRRKRTLGGMFANPARRPVRRRRRRSAVVTMRRNPIRRRRVSMRRYRRNPIGGRGGGMGLMAMLVPGVMIGVGAVGSEVLAGYLPIPASMKTGYARHVVKAGIGVSGGYVISKFFKQPKLGGYFALGAIAIAAHDMIKDAVTGTMPKVPFGEYVNMGYASPAMISGPDGGYGEYVDVPASSMAGNNW